MKRDGGKMKRERWGKDEKRDSEKMKRERKSELKAGKCEEEEEQMMS